MIVSWKIAAAGGAILVTLILVAYLALRAHHINIGWQRAINEIAAQNTEAINAAETARARVRACHARGLRWDQVAGDCERP